MTNAISIRPSRELRNNYSEISSLAKKNPIAITVNGREDTVILSHEYFIECRNYISELEDKLKIYAHLAQSEDDIKLGRVNGIDEAFDDIFEKLDETAG